MPNINWALFLPTTLIMLLTPGPAVMYIIVRGINQGRRSALVSVFGIACGALVHVAAAVLGLSALMLASALAFSVVKYLGAAYLIYLGIRTLLTRAKEVDGEIVIESQPLRKVFTQAIVVSILNPQTALFFLAFLPQFVDPSHGSAPVQMFILGILFILMAMTTDSGYAILAGTLGGLLRGKRSIQRVQRYVTGTVYIGLGVAAALSGSSHSSASAASGS
jgi:threonine/homoserine/homoserine lactone efflux protein